MGKRIALCIGLFLTLFCVSVYAKGMESQNIHANNYEKYGVLVTSFLHEDEEGLERAEYIDNKIVIEKYTLDGEYVGVKKEIELQLPVFGGLYWGENYNYIVCGAQNKNDDNSCEVVRICRYDRNWDFLKFCSISGANTYYPFDFASCRMTEAKGKLYVYTSHLMYLADDGEHHQSNMQLMVDEENFDVVENPYYPYISHSFNQFIRTDGEYMYTLDHGDAYPRSVLLSKYKAGTSEYSVSESHLLKIVGLTGDNYTGVSVGGMELSENNVLAVGNTVKQDVSTFDTDKQRNIFLAVESKALGKPILKMLTEYTSSDGVTPYTPYIRKISDIRFLIMWEENRQGSYETKLALTDENGNIQKSGSIKLPLSDCEPVMCSDGLLKWYVTDNTDPTFYWLDPITFEAQKTVEEDWSFDPDTSTLTVGGKGEMPDGNLPWAVYNADIKHVVIKDGVRSLSNNAFSGCEKLESIMISDTVGKIGANVFEGCISLTDVVFGKSVKSIGDKAFSNCGALEKINMPDTIKELGEGMFLGCTALKSVVLPEGPSSLGDEMFNECSSLTAVKLPSTMQSIGSSAFTGCSKLENINLDKVKSIGYQAFYGCSSLEKVEFGESMTSIASAAFKECSSIKTLKIPEGIKGIQASAFSMCGSLERVELPSTVTYIDNSGFYDCYALKEIELPDSLTYLGPYAFHRCRALKKINIPEGVKTINTMTFLYCPLEDITIPKSVESIKSYAFWGCGLKYVRIPEGVTNIGYQAFSYSSIKAISLPKTITQLDADAFTNYSGKLYCYKGSTAENILSERGTGYGYIGDINADSSVDEKDVSLMLKYSDGYKSFISTNYDISARLDYDLDKRSSVLDAVLAENDT